MAKVAVIGAGISGLICSRVLQDAGHVVTVFEKSRSLGGRCATRLWNGHILDHGVQYFVAKTPEFQKALAAFPEDSLAEITSPIEDADGQIQSASSPRLYHALGNNRLGRFWGADLDIKLEHKIEAIESQGVFWEILGQPYAAVVSCAPWPQTAALFGLPETAVTYTPNLTAFLEYEGKPDGLAQHRYARVAPDEDLAWSACENEKPGRIEAGKTVFLVQAGEKFSETYLESEPAIWLPLLQKMLEDTWHFSHATCSATWSHRWRYARHVDGDLPEFPPGLFVTGDSTCDSKLEPVWHSGRKTALDVLAHLSMLGL
jgi:predicted NAD/FAD-dependent oxidoreductase